MITLKCWILFIYDSENYDNFKKYKTGEQNFHLNKIAP